MYFKQIAMHGFKSFADPTSLALDAGITAVVGPNGCGKSNILDALRWALGEQSAKALRGAHMQDVIFNGSEHRPAMGMSEVTLVFDNADSKLPVDFPEVAVTRRVYRSGESEYLLNGAVCRLKDIHELFMDTGIGTNAYSLIGQGKIDLVLSSKPEDRRFLFEEAAGIIKYKTRKKQAMRKLEGAEQNLLRLNDIIAEVQRQMRTLKRQVNAAIRHRELTEMLRALEVRNAWLHYNELSGQISDLKERYAVAAESYQKTSTKTTNIEAKEEELRLKRVELERVLMARRDGEYQIDSEMERLESDIALLRQEVSFCQQQHATAMEEHQDFSERATAIVTSQEQLTGQSTALSEELTQVRNGIAEHQTAYENAAKEVASSDELVEAMRNRALDTMTSRNRTQTEIETLHVTVQNLDLQLEGIYTRQQEGNSRQETLTQKLEELRSVEGGKQKTLNETSTSRQQRQNKRGELTAQMERLNEEWQRLRERKSSQEARLGSLRELRDSYEGFAIGVRAVMKAKQQEMPEADGVIGPVGDLVSTDKRFEQAIEAALGGNINNVIVENADHAKAAINFLKQHKAGRVTFLPLDTIRSSQHDDFDALKGHPGVIGKAINHVQYDPHVHAAMEYLFFNTVIVETIDDAIRIARSERRFPRLVTLDGDMVSSSGAVTGGRAKNESRGLLGRTAEIEELEVEVKKAEGRIGQIAGEGKRIAATIETLTQEIKALGDAELTLRDELRDVGVSLAQVTTELGNLAQSAEELGKQRDGLIERRNGLEELRLGAQERVKTIENDDEAIQREIAESQRKASDARQRLSSIGDALSDLRVRIAELTQNMEEAERNRLRVQQEHEDAAREAAKRLEIAQSVKAKEREIEESIANKIERSKALSETKEQAHGKMLDSQKELQAVVEAADAAAKELKQLHEKNAKAMKEVHDLEIDLTHKEERIDHFQERILNDYNLALSALDEKDVGTDEYDEKEREALIAESRKHIQRLGTVNMMAIEEYEKLEQRDKFLVAQEQDLRIAREKLLSVVARIDVTIKEMFMNTFKQVGENFKNYFRRLFNGGQARVYLVDENDPLETGIEIEARPPGKKPQTISLLSGGEQAMTAIALLFSIFSAKPSPFCVLDEVDAPLDDANVGRFLDMVQEFTAESQFIIITHSKQTMSRADALFGVTQQERGISQIVAVRFDEVKEEAVA